MVCEQKSKNNGFFTLTFLFTLLSDVDRRVNSSTKVADGGFSGSTGGIRLLAGWAGRCLPGAACLLDGSAQDELDLPVEATQIVVGPALESLQQGRIDTKQKRLSFSHATY